MRILYVDENLAELNQFQSTVEKIEDVKNLYLFSSGKEVLEWIKKDTIDIAFLNVQMLQMDGIALAKQLKKIDRNIRLVFIADSKSYAWEAFSVDAIGYVLRPYGTKELYKEIEKASRIRPYTMKRVKLRTIPDFSCIVDGEILHMGRAKTEELLALLVDRAEAGLTTGEAIAYLWPNRPEDDNSKTLYRVTFHRMMEVLKSVNAEHIVMSKGRKKYICKEEVECDLYHILDGDESAIMCYAGDYMQRFSWAETRNAQLFSLKEKLLK